ncbi:hypothetical protein [Pseudomonas syringae]|uniref:hypothetical protein n=1 Tax=Pseudomonas syringae TaxID=317 RepID=UPI001F106CBD|nr:hypothetical protein [Pseudomonas syringae]MCH5488319.1 hypothetical protein [Pseudomonas syringae pv. syringae]MCH5555757.1 hypothetical protein [Pseudomonas syringae pv. syringae]MCH5576259.1 hypothetical protein [Pseudomonas syringae pv. syringae]MCH5668524.1 hypothetical protein [Pseudomonas syringae pv. syringae]MDO1459461.1 hypothetical protein [Pseudomonas syringae pv. syringae]
MRRSEGNWYEAVGEAIKAMGADIAEIKRFQQDCERDKNIAMLMQINEKKMTQASTYTNLILVAGYAGFFAFWSTLVAKLPGWLYALSGLLALLSLICFICWELIKMIWGNVHLNRTNEMIIKTVRGPKAIALIDAASSLHSAKITKLWMWFLVPTVACGMSAGFLLLGYFVLEVWKSLH